MCKEILNVQTEANSRCTKNQEQQQSQQPPPEMSQQQQAQQQQQKTELSSVIPTNQSFMQATTDNPYPSPFRPDTPEYYFDQRLINLEKTLGQLIQMYTTQKQSMEPINNKLDILLGCQPLARRNSFDTGDNSGPAKLRHQLPLELTSVCSYLIVIWGGGNPRSFFLFGM